MTAKKIVQQLLETVPDTCTYQEIKQYLDANIDRFQTILGDQEAVMSGAAASLQIEKYPK